MQLVKLILLLPLLAFAADDRGLILGAIAHRAETLTSRVALVMGNSAYRSGTQLVNPVNDAKAMATVLSSLGFKVLLYENLTQREMARAIAKFGETLKEGSTGLVFYAGHGVQVKGRNYLIPIDADLRTENAVRSEAIDLEQILEQMEEAKTGLNILILDACRNNPFERRFRGNSGGLASMDAPKGTLIAYATGPGKVADDGDGANGLYTSELLKVIPEAGLRIEDVFKRVRLNVANRTNDTQLPWETSSLVGDFYFNSAKAILQQTADSVAHTLEIDVVEEEMQASADTPVASHWNGKEIVSHIKKGDWVRVTGTLSQLGKYRVAVNSNTGYASMSTLVSPWYQRIGRSYRGFIGNNVRKPDQVVTRFEILHGKIFGTYTVIEPSGKTDGTLSDFKETSSLGGQFTWKDAYGTGILEIKFDQNLAIFDGQWNVAKMPDQGGNWSGKRE